MARVKVCGMLGNINQKQNKTDFLQATITCLFSGVFLQIL